MKTPKLDRYMKLFYPIIVEKDQCTDGSFCYLASHPDLPGCMSQGETQEEALLNLQEAKQLYLETLLANNQDIPLPINEKTFTGFVGDNFTFLPSEQSLYIQGSEQKVEITKGKKMTKAWDLVETP
ncbi:MAG: type II toxin-antitoxin system HicB family antitoxin [Nitrospirales bacterium]